MSGHRKIVLRLAALVATMATLSFVAVPFYNWFCAVTGFAGTAQVATTGADTVLDRKMTIRFDANTDRDMAWTFRPVVQKTEVRIGETTLAFYEAHNPTDRPIAGSASFNVFPYAAGGYFNKIDCFCFELQVLQPGETAQLPVSFFVDPEILNDAEAKYVTSITLSYTFHQTELPQEQAHLFPAPANPVN